MRMDDLYREGADRLSRAGVTDARTDAWYLLEFVTGISRASYYADPKRNLADREVSDYREKIASRASRIPLQLIIGRVEFMGLPFLVDGNTLIPRQDSECLVLETLRLLKPGDRIMDLCTGSGCLIISILKYADRRLGAGNGVTGAAYDLSEKALRAAGKNAALNGISGDRLTFTRSDLFSEAEGVFDIILSNPPYIATGEIESLEPEVRDYDPRMALDGGADGLDFYKRITREAGSRLRSGGFLLFEIGANQASDVTALMKARDFADVKITKDLAGLDRVVSGCKI